VTNFVSLVLSGAVSGAVYALLAIGLVLAFSTSRVFNFGHAAVAFSCALLYYQLNSGLGWPVPVAAAAVVLVFAPLAGLVWDRLVFRRIVESPEPVKVVATIGIMLVMPALVQWIINILGTSAGVHFISTSDAYQTPGVGPNPPIQWHLLNGLIITSDQLILLGTGVALFLALWLVLRFTRLGLVIRSAVDRPALASLRGTRVSQVSAIAWISSFVMAGIAGVVAGPITGFGVVSDNYTVALFVAATAAVLAMLTSIPVAFAGALLLGALSNLAQGYLTPQYAGAVGRWVQSIQGLQASLPYWVLLIGLIVLNAERSRRAGTVAETTVPQDYTSHLPAWRRRLPWAIATVALIAYSMGPINPIWRQGVETGLAMAMIFLSFTIVTGIGGMISLAQPAFATAGGVFTGLLVEGHGWPFIPAVLAAALIATILGILVALPALRLGGIALALATLALALLGFSVFFQLSSLTNNAMGWTLERPKLGFLNLANDRLTVIVLLVLVLLTVWVVGNLHKSPSGRAMIAVRTSEPAAAASAVSPTTTKLTLFALSAFVAGVGGALAAMVSGSVTIYSPAPLSFLWLAVVVVFGIRRPGAAVLAGVVYVLFPMVLASGVHIGHFGWNGTTETLIPQILFGLGAIGLAKNPDGALSQFAERRHRRRAERAPSEPAVAELQEVRSVRSVSAVSVTASARVPSNGKAAETAALRLSGVRAGYGAVQVLHGVDLEVPAGSITAVLGPNGAGKTTLCNVLAGAVRTSSGTVSFFGDDVHDLETPERVDKGLVLVPESRGVFPALTVDENLSLLLPGRDDRERAYERFPNLAVRRRTAAGNLSGGEQQMLGLAPMFVKPPRLLIVDEPTLGLAEIVAAQVMDAIAELPARGTTVLLVEEKARGVLKHAHHVAVIYNGRIRWTSPMASFDMNAFQAAYTGGIGSVEPLSDNPVTTEAASPTV
jgi:ABC-type branched-subunit amino acid transport system ATPase component/branched-subunit amino acid ABC-type transport system permease component